MRAKMKRLPMTLLATFLLMFMLLIFGPSEIFFSNVSEFQFVYKEFAGYMTAFAVMGTVVLTALLVFLPDKLYRFFLSGVFGVSLAGYLQIMFLNKNLDMLGLNPDGYHPDKAASVGNLAIWLVVIGIVIGVCLWKKEIFKKLVVGGAAFLLCIQLVALVSLWVTADEKAFKYPMTEASYHLSGEEQYTVSANENVIVFVLDMYSNWYLKSMLEYWPDGVDFLHDFTYYSNTDCNVYGTYPSLPRLLTGNEYDMYIPVDQWLEESWTGERAEYFYDMLHENNYIANVYTVDTDILSGSRGLQLLDGKIENVVNSSQEIDIFYKLLFKTMGKMSAYRMAPEALKTFFYDGVGDYIDIVSLKENKVRHHNWDFYEGLQENGLKTDDSSNYYIVQHLRGEHAWTTDQFGGRKEESTAEETAKGLMVIVEAYLNQLKELGVYDNSTIIILADHGTTDAPQSIFFIKNAWETHDELVVTNAPITLQEFVPTIVENMGYDYTMFGQSIYEFSQDEQRERTIWIRKYDENYPSVPCYTGDKPGDYNVYCGYAYTGDIWAMFNKIYGEPTVIIPMVDSFH